MFSGMTNTTLDAKGRIILPAKIREELGESFYITSGIEDCLQVISKQHFKYYSEQIDNMSGDKAAPIQYLILGSAVEVSPNAQGRISIPQALREEAGLEKNVVVVGLNSRVEIWDSEKFQTFKKEQKRLAKLSLQDMKL